MHRTVRYYITESDDQPVVRTVPVAVVRTPARNRPNAEQQATPAPSKNGKFKVGTKVGKMKLPTSLRRSQSR